MSLLFTFLVFIEDCYTNLSRFVSAFGVRDRQIDRKTDRQKQKERKTETELPGRQTETDREGESYVRIRVYVCFSSDNLKIPLLGGRDLVIQQEENNFYKTITDETARKIP